MANTNVLEALAGLLANGNGKQTRKSDVRKPDDTFFVPGTDNTLQIGIYRSVHSRDGRKSLNFDPRRVKEGKLLKTMQIQQLPALLLGLLTVARAASRDEQYVDATTRARLAFIADNLETVVTASEANAANGESSELSESSFFELAS